MIGWAFLAVCAALLAALFFIRNKTVGEPVGLRGTAISGRAWDRDYIMGTICSIIESLIDEIDPKTLASGRFTINHDIRSIGWSGSESSFSSHQTLVNLESLDSTDKTLIIILFEGARDAKGFSRIVAVDMCALYLHKILKEQSDFYRGLGYIDSRFS